MSDYERPRRKPGLVCHYCEWDKAGKVRRALYRPIKEAAAEAAIPGPCARHEKPKRGAMAEAQGRLI